MQRFNQQLKACKFSFVISINHSRPADYVQGTIKVHGKIVSYVKGSYLGHIRIDGKKYYDCRYHHP